MKRRQSTAEKLGLSAAEYQLLVEELMKDRPDQVLIRKLMLKNGIPYTADPIAQMSLILHSMGKNGIKPKEPSRL